MSPALNSKITSVQGQLDALVALMSELQAAQTHGNLARVGNAAHDAEEAAWSLWAGLGDVFGLASRLDAKAYDAGLVAGARV